MSRERNEQTVCDTREIQKINKKSTSLAIGSINPPPSLLARREKKRVSGDLMEKTHVERPDRDRALTAIEFRW